MLAVGRMYLDTGLLAEAQAALVSAGQGGSRGMPVRSASWARCCSAAATRLAQRRCCARGSSSAPQTRRPSSGTTARSCTSRCRSGWGRRRSRRRSPGRFPARQPRRVDGGHACRAPAGPVALGRGGAHGAQSPRPRAARRPPAAAPRAAALGAAAAAGSAPVACRLPPGRPRSATTTTRRCTAGLRRTAGHVSEWQWHDHHPSRDGRLGRPVPLVGRHRRSVLAAASGVCAAAVRAARGAAAACTCVAAAPQYAQPQPQYAQPQPQYAQPQPQYAQPSPRPPRTMRGVPQLTSPFAPVPRGPLERVRRDRAARAHGRGEPDARDRARQPGAGGDLRARRRCTTGVGSRDAGHAVAARGC